jgi:hypothetical protein
MGCEIRRARYLSEIGSVRELREARRELEIREFFARERLEMDVMDTLSPENMMAMVAPPGSLIYRVIGSVESGLATVQGIGGVLGSLFGGVGLFGGLFGGRSGGRSASRGDSRTGSRRVSRSVSRTVSRTPASPKKSHVGRHAEELEIEVELDPEPRPRRAPAKR